MPRSVRADGPLHRVNHRTKVDMLKNSDIWPLRFRNYGKEPCDCGVSGESQNH